MNKSHGFTKENLLRSLPPGLANDLRMVALAEAIAGLLVQQKEETGRLSIYPQIGKLDEALLDILAHDFKVDWWDSDYTLTEKRRTLQTSWQVHKTLGTKAAVQKAITAIFPNTTIEEWFEYGGQPYHFRLSIELGGEHLDREKQARVLERVSYYKNLRSHLDSVSYATKFDTVPFGNHRTAAYWLKTAGFDLRFLNGVLQDCTTLSGEKRLDGTWVLGQSLWGLAMEAVELSTSFCEPAGGSIRPFVMDFGVHARNPARLGLSAACSIPIRERGHAELPQTAIALGARNAFGFTAGQILNGEWLFDGSASFNGRRDFDGPVIREIL